LWGLYTGGKKKNEDGGADQKGKGSKDDPSPWGLRIPQSSRRNAQRMQVDGLGESEAVIATSKKKARTEERTEKPKMYKGKQCPHDAMQYCEGLSFAAGGGVKRREKLAKIRYIVEDSRFARVLSVGK